MTLEIMCLGHLAPRTRNCGTCKKDDYNSHCPVYIPINVHTFEVVESQPAGMNPQVAKFYKKYGYDWMERYLKGGRKNGFTQRDNTRVSTSY